MRSLMTMLICIAILQQLCAADAVTIDGSSTTINKTTTVSEELSVTKVTESTSPTTGALKVSGGVGVEKDVNVGGTVASANATISRTADATGAELVRGDDTRLQSNLVGFIAFDGTNLSVRRSKNLTVTRNSVGHYIITIAPGVVPDGNYVVVCNASHASYITWSTSCALIPTIAPTATSFHVGCGYNTTGYDPKYVNIVVYR